MRTIRAFAVLWAMIALATLAWGSEAPAASHEAGAEAAHHAEGGHHELPLNAVPIFGKDGFVTNSMVVTWIVALALILCARAATRQMRAVPEGAQNFWEWLVESLHDFLAGIIGIDLVKRTFWFFATIFIFILSTNWFGLIPGVGTIGFGEPTEHGFLVTAPLFRGVNADLNMTAAMSMIFFVMWTVWAIQVNGVGGFVHHIFGAKGDTTGALKFLMTLVFFAVGILEVVSILFRPVSLSFRLFGNVYAGENMLESMANLVPSLAWLIPIPFYFLEVLVGLVQAMVFMLLTSVFTLLICSHEEGHAEEHH